MTRPRLIDNAADGLGRMMPPRLSIDANRFTLIDAGGNEKPHDRLNLDVVFIDLNPKVSKMFWGKDYNPGETGDIPVCWSDNGTAPSSQAATPQSPACMTCAHNVIGSAISKFTQAKIKACVDMKKLAFIVPGDPQNVVFLMTVKPGSFKNWATYINFLKAQKFTDGSQPDLSDVVTRLEFESQGVLKFSPAAPVVGDKMLETQREAAWARNISGEIVGQNDVPYTPSLAAPVAQQHLPPPAQPAAQQVQQPVPFVAPAATQPMSPTTPGVFPAASSSDASKRKRRTKAEIEAASAAAAVGQTPAPMQFANPQPAPTPVAQPPVQQVAPSPGPGQAADPLDIPSFLQRNPAPAPAAPQPSFGLAQGAEPDAAMTEAIAKAFALPV